MRRRSIPDATFRDRYRMRPSIARMTLDLGYGDTDYEVDATGKSTHGLQNRLAELLVFEIHRDGGTEFKSLSVRGLYKYVLKAVKFSAERRKPLRASSISKFSLSQLMKKDSEDEDDTASEISHHNNNNNNNNNNNDDDNVLTSNSVSDVDEDKADELRGVLLNKKSGDNKQNQNSITSQSGEEKSVSFGGPQGPMITEHPPKIPGVPIALEQELQAAAVANKPFPALPHTPTMGQVTYRERLGGFLHPRDMRRLVTPFSASNEPELIVRRHVMLLNFDPLRAVILRDRLLVLVPDGADSLLVDLEKRVRGGAREVERSVFGETHHKDSNVESNFESINESSNIDGSVHSSSPGLTEPLTALTDDSEGRQKRSTASSLLNKGKGVLNNDKTTNRQGSFASSVEESTLETTQYDDAGEFQEWEEMASRDWIDLPFELQCLDAVLGSVCAILGKDATELQTNSINAMERLILQGGQEDILRHVKNSITEMNQRVKGFIRALNLVLDETEDMALMNLSRLLTHPERFIQPVPEEILDEESDEPELILEAHLQQGFSLTNSLDLVMGEIQTTQELINQRSDAVRNRLLLANMIISIGSLCVATGSFIGSIFGMNVTNHMEQDPNAFRQIVVGTGLGMIGMVLTFALVLWYAGTMPSLRSSF